LLVTKWELNKIAAIIISIVILSAFAKYYRIYNFAVSPNDRLLFWVPLVIVGLVSGIIYIWTFNAKRRR
jgi:hypothetical protein